MPNSNNSKNNNLPANINNYTAITIPIDPKRYPKPFSRDIFLFATHIAGTTHVDLIDEALEGIGVSSEVSFFREANNIHDKYAIVVKNKNGQKLGYIPKFDNIVFARLLDAGKLLVGKVKSIEKLGSWNKIKIDLYLRD